MIFKIISIIGTIFFGLMTFGLVSYYIQKYLFPDTFIRSEATWMSIKERLKRRKNR